MNGRPPLPLQQILEQAVRCHQTGQLIMAERCYRMVLAIVPHHADSLHLFGVLSHQTGHPKAAIRLISAAVRMAGHHPVYHSNLALALKAEGRTAETISCYREALRLKPDALDVLYGLGDLLQEQCQFDEAVAFYRRALALKPDHGPVLNNFGSTYKKLDRLDEAVVLYRHTLALRPDYPEALNNLGSTYKQQDRFDQAVALYRKALALKPDYAEAVSNLGNGYYRLNQLDTAAVHYRRALTLAPDSLETLNNLGTTLHKQGRLEEAVAIYRRALAFEPACAATLAGLGEALFSLKQSAAALWAAQTARTSDDHCDRAYAVIAGSLVDLGRYDMAFQAARLALTLKPDNPTAQFIRGVYQLAHGRLDRGWSGYRWRWPMIGKEASLSDYRFPAWHGEPLPDGDLLVWPEQGLGDEIMFLSLLPDLTARGIPVQVQCDHRLHPLLARRHPGIRLYPGTADAASITDSRIVAQVPAGELPALLRPTLDSFPPAPTPPLCADPAAVAAARARHESDNPGVFRIGISWHSQNRQHGQKRSLPPVQLAAALTGPGIRLINLQYGNIDAPAAAMAAAGVILHRDDTVDTFNDIDGLAALIMACDLVVTMDNTTAHLAGALGVPVWTLLPAVADWRWMLDRSDSPWYPAMRLFRQTDLGGWSPVLAEVAAALADLRAVVAPAAGMKNSHAHNGSSKVPPHLQQTRP